MKTVNIHEAKTNLSRLLQEAVAGEDIVIAKAGKPMVRLVAIGVSKGTRALGILSGQVNESADCWKPDQEIEELFYGSQPDPVPVRRVAERRPKRKRGKR